MKKALLLLVLPLFILFGCGSQGLEPTVGSLDGNIPGGSADGGNDIVGDDSEDYAGRLTVYFPEVQKDQASRAVVDMSGATRNRARLLVRQVKMVATTWSECVDYDEFEDECYEEVERTTNVEKETFRKIKDGPLDGSGGSGSVTIAVPPDEGYELEVLTYYQGTDLLGSEVAHNFILEYGKSTAKFTVDAGVVNTVALEWPVLATLILPESVTAGSTYEVSAALSTALRPEWYARQTLDETASRDLDLADQRIIHEDTDTSDKFGKGVLKLQAPVKDTKFKVDVTQWPLWVQGQFFISEHLLEADEASAWKNWTYGTSYAGQLNPLGTITVSAWP